MPRGCITTPDRARRREEPRASSGAAARSGREGASEELAFGQRRASKARGGARSKYGDGRGRDTASGIAHLAERPLAPGEPCPTLYRYPGPCGLALWFAGRLERLAPGDVLWMSALPIVEDSYGARHFGTLALRRPLDFAPAVAGPGIYVAENRPLRPDDDIVWIGADRARAIDGLCRYLEELDAMRLRGAPGPGIPWCRVPLRDRLRLLAAFGVTPVWSGSETEAPWYNPRP